MHIKKRDRSGDLLRAIMRHYQYTTAVAVLSAGSLVYGADESNESLKKTVQEMEQRLRIVEGKSDAQNEGTPTRKAAEPRLSAGPDGFSFSSADTNFVLRLRGYVQADGRFYVGDHIPANDTFLMRRVRPIFEGILWKYYDFRIMLDFGSGATSSSLNNGFLQDGYLNVRYWPEFQVQAGKFKPPVGLERLQSGANLVFAERGLPSQFTPTRDVGLQLHGKLFGDVLGYQAGVFNGVQDNTSGDSDVGVDDHKDVAARLFAHPFKKTNIRALQGLGIGAGGSIGNQTGALPSYKTPGQQTFFSYVTGAGTNVNVTADGEHWRLIPQAYYYWGPFGLYGEYAISSQTIRRDMGGSAPVFRTPHHRAWQVVGSFFVTGETNSYSPVKPEHALNFAEHRWGALELAARYGELTIDEELFGGPSFATASSAHKIRSWGLGVNWYLNRNVKLMLDYDQSDFRGGSTAPRQVTAQDEKVIITRIQVSF
jgi:phosphate-selective porin OprO/OprP